MERYNRTLKNALRKQAVHYQVQWNQLLPGVMWAYCNTLHETTHENLSYLLLEWIAGLRQKLQCFPPPLSQLTCMSGYREELSV